MILGMPTSVFLAIHVAISLIGILTGLVALAGMLRNRHLPVWVAAFLATTLLTSLTGFPLPPFGIDPPRIVGVIELVLLALAGAGLYLFALAGAWRGTYVVTATAALYLNVFVAVVQSFLKIGPLNALAPTQTEPPFAIAQALVLALFIALGFLAFRRFGRSNAIESVARRTNPA